jgi:hypothetical protein
MLDWPSHLREVAQHLILMANTPGWQEHAKLRRDEMLADPMYAGLREEIMRQLQEAKARSST